MSQYPVWKHHKEHKAKLIHSEEQEKALGEGWGDSSAVWREPVLDDLGVDMSPAEEPSEAEALAMKSVKRRGRKSAT